MTVKTYIGTKIIQAEPRARGDAAGYIVRYPDGYESWSPKAAFEEAYRVTSGMTFGDAVHMLKLGKRVARGGWNGKGMHLELQRPDSNSKMTLPYVWMKTADEQRVPWLASQTDVLAEDWQLVEAGA